MPPPTPSPPQIAPFNPSPEHVTLTTTIHMTSTATMDIYQQQDPSTPSSTATSAPSSSWVIATYTPPHPLSSASSSSPIPEPTHTLLSIPTHWHAHHDELMSILSGRMKFFIEGEEKILSEGEELLIRRGTRHGFTVIRGEGVSFRERTVPDSGGFKGAFFKDLFGAGPNPGVLHAMRTFSEGDTYASLPLPLWTGDWGKWFDYWFTHMLGALGRMVLPAREVGNMIAEIEGANEEAADGKAKTA